MMLEHQRDYDALRTARRLPAQLAQMVDAPRLALASLRNGNGNGA